MATKKKTSRTTKAAKASPSRTAKPRPAKSAAARASKSTAPDAETRRLEAIVDVFGRSDLAELEYEDKDISLKLSRYAQSAVSMPAVTPSAVASAPPPAATEPAPAVASNAPGAEAHVLKSPFVGTFYRAASPEAPPFTEAGQRVSKGQTLCIIEAMKLMNEIPSDVDGRIVSVLVDNGEPVQFGDPLFEIAVK